MKGYNIQESKTWNVFFLVYVSNSVWFSVQEKSKFECRLVKVCRSWFLLLRLYKCFKTLFFKKKKSKIFDQYKLLLLLICSLGPSLIPSVTGKSFHSK